MQNSLPEEEGGRQAGDLSLHVRKYEGRDLSAGSTCRTPSGEKIQAVAGCSRDHVSCMALPPDQCGLEIHGVEEKDLGDWRFGIKTVQIFQSTLSAVL